MLDVSQKWIQDYKKAWAILSNGAENNVEFPFNCVFGTTRRSLRFHNDGSNEAV